MTSHTSSSARTDAAGHAVGVNPAESYERFFVPVIAAPFLWQYVASTPLAGALAGVDRQRRAALEADVVRRWERVMHGGALMMDLEMSVVTARRR